MISLRTKNQRQNIEDFADFVEGQTLITGRHYDGKRYDLVACALFYAGYPKTALCKLDSDPDRLYTILAPEKASRAQKVYGYAAPNVLLAEALLPLVDYLTPKEIAETLRRIAKTNGSEPLSISAVTGGKVTKSHICSTGFCTPGWKE